MDVALDHEYSHATQFDNLKLLLLQFLPRIHFRLRDGRTWMRVWQNSAEWAADDDAVRGDKRRVFLLAEMLVAIARPANRAVPQVLCAQLACGETELEHRIERLLDAPAGLPRSQRSSVWIVAVGIAFGAAGMAARLTPWLHGLSERLLHLG
jgi:beta-lactamase regulating signal transducer with metallopeptidase domain